MNKTIRTASLALIAAFYSATAQASAFISPFTTTSNIASTIPGNGDVNPYGVAVVPESNGDLRKGNILVSNFNNSGNLQGQGTTIVQITPAGAVSTFATLNAGTLPDECPGGVGLTTALAVLKRGWVIVGSLPTKGPTAAFAGPGCLIVLDDHGRPVSTIHGFENGINGPWDMASFDEDGHATLFVTNVLNGHVTSAGGAVVNEGTVVRLELDVPDCDSPIVKGGHALPQLEDATIIGSGFSERTDPAALIVGPTGAGFDPRSEILYIADTVNNRIAAIPNALRREKTAFAGDDVTANIGLNQPLGLVIAPNGDILTVNGGDGNIIETTPQGAQVALFTLVPSGAGALFGLAVVPGGSGIYFINDNTNMLSLFH